jgi:hypothetical protein
VPVDARARRDRRYELRRLLWRFSTMERVRACGRNRLPGRERQLRVGTRGEDGGRVAHFTGSMLCGSVWACPACSAEVNAARAEEIGARVGAWVDAGDFAAMVTLTLAHGRADPLEDTFGAVVQAFGALTSGRARIRVTPLLEVLPLLHSGRGFLLELKTGPPVGTVDDVPSLVVDGEQRGSCDLVARAAAVAVDLAAAVRVDLELHGRRLQTASRGSADGLGHVGRRPLPPGPGQTCVTHPQGISLGWLRRQLAQNVAGPLQHVALGRSSLFGEPQQRQHVQVEQAHDERARSAEVVLQPRDVLNCPVARFPAWLQPKRQTFGSGARRRSRGIGLVHGVRVGP